MRGRKVQNTINQEEYFETKFYDFLSRKTAEG